MSGFYMAEVETWRQQMRQEIHEMRRDQQTWRTIKAKIARDCNDDPTQIRLTSKANPHLSDAFKGVEFHRDMAAMYASAIAAELAVQDAILRTPPVERGWIGGEPDR